MFKRRYSTVVLAAILQVFLLPATSADQTPTRMLSSADQSVVCSVMEAFTDAKLGVRAVVFHQADKADGPRLGSLLLAHTGEEMELQLAGGRRYRATVFRVKSAFGRGLVLLPASAPNLAEHQQFKLTLIGKK